MWGGAYWGGIPWAGTLVFGGGVPGQVCGDDYIVACLVSGDAGSMVTGGSVVTHHVGGSDAGASVSGGDSGGASVSGYDRSAG